MYYKMEKFTGIRKSLIYIINKRLDPWLDPCGTPCCMSSIFEREDSNCTYCFRFDMCLANFMRCHLFHSVYL